MKVHIPTPLRSYTNNEGIVECSGATVGEALSDLDRRFSGFRFRIIDEQDGIREHIKIFVNEEQARDLAVPVGSSDVVHIICALSGGAPAARLLPIQLALFVGSGCAALIYEIVWFQLLQLVIGSSAVSLGVLLGTFMGGMCLGSLALPRFVSAKQNPLRVYALLELGTGIIGVLVLFGMPFVGGLYAANGVHGFAGILFRGLICAICLLPPTLLMGATLPAVARSVEATSEGVAWLGFFYGGNIAGAVLGSLLAGFYLLRVYDMSTATFVAAGINVVVAALAFVFSLSSSSVGAVSDGPGRSETAPTVDWNIYTAIALSGMCALGAEVVWTRTLSLMLGASVYTFSIILAVFLTGLGIGSSIGSYMARAAHSPRLELGCCQMFLVPAIAWTASVIGRSLPFWPVNPSLATHPWFIFQLDVIRCAWAILPAAILWGASFPLAIASVASREQDPGRVVGGVYAANTVGAIIGSVGFSIAFIQWLGTQQAERLLVGLSALSALLVLAPIVWPAEKKEGDVMSALCLAVSVMLAAVLAWTVPPIPGGLVAYGRFLATKETPNVLYLGEGMNASVAVTELNSGVRNFHVSGKVEASSEPQDMRLQRMLGHIPALVHPKPRSVLIVGFGAGVTAGTFVLHPDVEKIVVCEIEPLIPQIVSEYFSKENYDVAHDPRVQIVYDDARHYILTTQEKFDIITSDPIHPWVKGAATLYTREYFDLVKKHLNPGGVVTQWAPLYESSTDVVRSEVATFFDTFPGGTVWSNDINGSGYDVVLLGQADNRKIDVDELQQRLDRPEYMRVKESLGEVGFKSAVDMLSTYAGQNVDLTSWLHDAQINRDRNLRLQYMAGLFLNAYDNARIYREMVAYRRFPDELLLGSEDTKAMLRQVIGRQY